MPCLTIFLAFLAASLSAWGGTPPPGDYRFELEAGGAEPAHSTPEDFACAIAHDVATWSKVVKAGDIKVE